MRSSHFHLPILLVLVLAGCSGGARWITYGRGEPLDAAVIDPGARMESISFGLLEGTAPVTLPSGDIIACQQVTPYELRMERLAPGIASGTGRPDAPQAMPTRVWSTSLTIPDSRRAVEGDGGGWVIPADQGLLLHAAGATVGLLCARRVGPDSLAISARRFDTATGRLLRDTVLMRQHIDASIPEVARQVSVTISPGGERIAVYARVRAYGLETTDLAIQILDSYLNPMETRKIRCRLADQDQSGLVQITDDGTMVILTKSGEHEAEILRIGTGGGAPERRAITFDGDNGIVLRHYAITLSGDGLLQVVAMASRSEHFTGLASGRIDFAGTAPARLTPAPLREETFAGGGIRALLPMTGDRSGTVVVYALDAPSMSRANIEAGPGMQTGAAAIDTAGRMLWHRIMAWSTGTGDWRSAPLDARIAGSDLEVVFTRNDSLFLASVPLDGARPDVAIRPLLRFSRSDHHAGLMSGTLGRSSDRTSLTFGVATQDLDDIDRQDRKLVHIQLRHTEN